MTLSLAAACLWCIAANLIAMLPTRDHHWRAAYTLTTLGAPILVALWWQNGWAFALAYAVAAGSILRWPVWFALRRLRLAFARADG